MARLKRGTVLSNLEVEDMAAEGKSIARYNDKVVFIPYAAPGDVVDVQVIKDKKQLIEANVVQYHKLSENRAEPRCEHFGMCGGCKWQHIPYEQQLTYKQRQVKDNFERLGHLSTETLEPILGSADSWFYRNKLEFTATNWRWLQKEEIESGEEFDRNALGFHMPGAFDKILDINKCWLQSETSNDIRNFIKNKAKELGMEFYQIRHHQGNLRNVIIRTSSSGELMVIIQFGREEDLNQILLEAVRQQFPTITSLLFVINSKMNETFHDLEVQTYAGNDCIYERMPVNEEGGEELRFKIGPKSFYQTNSAQAYQLYKIARDLADIQPDETVYDLYTGTGTIANFIAHQAEKVIGIEYVEEAIKDAIENSKLNGVNNTAFFAGDMKDVLNDKFIYKHGKPATMIVDPPRAGMHQDVVDTILAAAPDKIIYVSCNPATQARDLDLMRNQYEIVAIKPVDMFPHTAHVENVVKLVKKG